MPPQNNLRLQQIWTWRMEANFISVAVPHRTRIEKFDERTRVTRNSVVGRVFQKIRVRGSLQNYFRS